jgi:mannobiose 2-epimerase
MKEEQFLTEIRGELDHVLQYWNRYAVDTGKGGFAGKINNANNQIPGASKGTVLNSRILWTFSAAYSLSENPAHLALAERAFCYIRDHFNDPIHGGLYWSVDAAGNLLDSHKQIYAQSFGIYGMSEYYRATGSEEALEMAIAWFRLVEQYSLDKQYGGYIDAFSRDWSFLEDKRLSAKDSNAVKTMNTHLHIIEGYSNLYKVWPDSLLRIRIRELLTIFDERILNKQTGHLELFFDERWTAETGIISYGHDIEAGWLLQHCAESIGDANLISVSKFNAIRITDAAMEGFDQDAGLWYELDTKANRLVKEKHWWPQAEALVGLCNAWQISGDPRYQEAMFRNWLFIKKYILDPEAGEWYWGVNSDHIPMEGQDKAGFWKCPYHNSRACMEIIRRLTTHS